MVIRLLNGPPTSKNKISACFRGTPQVCRIMWEFQLTFPKKQKQDCTCMVPWNPGRVKAPQRHMPTPMGMGPHPDFHSSSS